MSLSTGMNFGLGVNLAIQGLNGIKSGQDALKRISRVMKGTTERSKELTKALNKMNRIDLRMDKVKSQLSDMRTKMTGAIASAGAIAVPVKFAGDLEAAMMDFNDAAGLDPAELAKMGDAMRRIGNASGQTQAQMAELGGVIKRLGVDNKDLVGYLETTSKMQVAMGISTDDMKSHLSTMDAAWKMSSKELEHFGDGLFVLQTKFNASASSILKHTARTAASTRKLGLDAASASAMVAAMSKAARGPGQLESAVADLASGLSGLRGASEESKAALASVGLGADFLATAFDADPKKALDTFLERMQAVAKTDKKKADAVLSEVFGGSGKVVSMLVDNFDQYKAASAEMANSTGAMAAAADDVGNSFNATFGDFYNAIKNINTQIGELFLPYAKMMFAALRDGAIWLSDFIAEHKTLAKVVFGALGAFAALKVGFFAVRAASLAARLGVMGFSKQLLFAKNAAGLLGGGLLGTLRKGFLAAATAARGFSLAMLSNPIGWIIAGVAALGVVVIKNIKKITAFFSGMWEGIKEGIAEAFAPLAEVFAPLFAALAPVGEAFGWLWGKIKAFFGWLFGASEESEEKIQAFGSAGKLVGKVIAAAFNLITAPIRWVIALIGGAIDAVKAFGSWCGRAIDGAIAAWDWLNDVQAKVAQSIVDAAASVGRFFADIWRSCLAAVGGFFSSLWDKVRGIFGTLGEYLTLPAVMMKDAFLNAFKWISEKLDWVAEKWRKVKNFFSFGGGDEEEKSDKKSEKKSEKRLVGPGVAELLRAEELAPNFRNSGRLLGKSAKAQAAPPVELPKPPKIANIAATAALATQLAAAPVPPANAALAAAPAGSMIAAAAPSIEQLKGSHTTNQNVSVSVNLGEVSISAKDGKFNAEELAAQVQKAVMAALERAERNKKNRSVIDDF